MASQHICEHIREDAYECTQKASWVVSPNDDPYAYRYACNDHLTNLLPKNDTAYVGHYND